MSKRTANNGWGKVRYVWKWYKGRFTKSGKDRRVAALKELAKCHF